MNNYQLTSTNVLLGGQMKWNLEVKTNKDDMFVSDFFLSPISKWISFDRPDRDLLKYTHEENIKDLYKSIRGDFFEAKLDPRLLIKSPIITDTPELVDTYCDMYDMGVSRTSISKTGKSLQVFCPVWLEKIKQNSKIEFEISIYTKQVIDNNNWVKDVDIRKRLCLVENDYEYHSRFVKYFNNYVSEIVDSTTEVVGDKLINVDFNNSYMSIEGISVESGKNITKNISYVLPNLVSIFRPMMDTDDLIISNFKNNLIISKQLFNFNIIFDIEDILPRSLFSQMLGQELFFEVKCFVDDKELEIKSFSHDYSKDFTIKDSNPLKCTLDFFEDYNSIQHIDKNKLSPQILHWASVNDNEYIFNVYPDALWNTNLWGTNVSDDNSCIHWCNNDLMFGGVNYGKSIGLELLSLINTQSKLERYSTFKSGNVFVNNVFYKSNVGGNPVRLYINIVKDLFNEEGESRIEKSSNIFELNLPNPDQGGALCGYLYNRFDNLYNIIIDERYINELSFRKMVDGNAEVIDKILGDEMPDNEYVKLKDILTSNCPSRIISVDNTIVASPADSPTGYDNKISELQYKKSKIPYQYLFRTDGHIKPAFVSPNRCKFYAIKKICKDEYVTNWDKLVKTKFPALYPSISYFFIDEIIKNDRKIENRWFNESCIIVLERELNFKIRKDVQNSSKSIKEDLISRIKDYYNIDNELVDYVYSLYNTTISFEYNSPENINEYIYDIKMSLK